MSDTSHIEWTDATWNPTTGCTKISPGCAHCYIETTPPFRMEGRKFVKGKIPLRLHADRLDKPLHWRKPRRVFVNSMSDLFHEDVPEAFIDRVFGVMAKAYWHTFQVLTKRADRMASYLGHTRGSGNVLVRINGAAQEFDWPGWAMDEVNRGAGWNGFPYPNVWLGVSVEDQQRANERIPWLLKTPAAVRFLSCEPLLGPVELGDWLLPQLSDMRGILTPEWKPKSTGIDWVIAGGESGPGSRPCSIHWIRSIVDQCRAAGVPCFVKQLGASPQTTLAAMREFPGWNKICHQIESEGDDATVEARLRDRKGGDPSEWPTDLRVREFPTNHDQGRKP